MKRFLLIVLTFFLLPGMTSCSDNADKSLDKVLSKDKIIVGLDYDLYPLVIEGKNDGLMGFTVDYVNELAGRLGVSAEFVNINNKDFSSALSENNIDCFINLTNPSREEKADFYLVESFVYHKQTVVVNTSSKIKSLADLSKMRVGVVKNSYASKTLKGATVLSSSLEGIEYYANTDVLLNNLSNGSVAAAVIDNVDLYYALKNNKGYNFSVLKEAVATDCYYMCFERNDVKLKEKTNSIIESMYSDGTVKSLSEKWFGVDLTENGV